MFVWTARFHNTRVYFIICLYYYYIMFYTSEYTKWLAMNVSACLMRIILYLRENSQCAKARVTNYARLTEVLANARTAVGNAL
jgi:hypothetical protein